LRLPNLFPSWLAHLDAWIGAALPAIACFLLLSGVDDLIIDAVWFFHWMRRRPARGGAIVHVEMRDGPEKRIAIFVPLWREHLVIGGMVEHNLSAIDYRNYEIFIGAYPNDDLTVAAVRDLEARFDRVRLAVCPHDGPTSKADCLNWIYQRMLLVEEAGGARFDIVVTHDAEDLIHPEALAAINHYADSYDMVQIPVLPLPTPVTDFTHGVYCDEFAEFQLKDIGTRGLLGSFTPSNGVGTGYTRAALEKLADAEQNRVFEPACLTEDYENGLRLHELNCTQIFVPLTRASGGFVATREFFPQNMHAAIRQRTRWIMGIALQTWERRGWRGKPAHIYWFWRDRKGLIGNPLSLLTNLIFLYGGITWVIARHFREPWGLAGYAPHPLLLTITLSILCVQTAIRMGCVARVYGPAFALGVPLRVPWANYINAAATIRALYRYFRARARNEPLVWLKTDHNYPSRSALLGHKRKLGEILVGSAYVTQTELNEALETKPRGLRIGEHLVALGKLSEEDLYEALSLQQSLPLGRVEPVQVNANVARSLPRDVIRGWKVVPFRIAAGSMFLASPEIPTDQLSETLRGFTRMGLRFQLVTPGNFEELTSALL
jgi:adsorption protein B